MDITQLEKFVTTTYPTSASSYLSSVQKLKIVLAGLDNDTNHDVTYIFKNPSCITPYHKLVDNTFKKTIGGVLGHLVKHDEYGKLVSKQDKDNFNKVCKDMLKTNNNTSTKQKKPVKDDIDIAQHTAPSSDDDLCTVLDDDETDGAEYIDHTSQTINAIKDEQTLIKQSIATLTEKCSDITNDTLAPIIKRLDALDTTIHDFAITAKKLEIRQDIIFKILGKTFKKHLNQYFVQLLDETTK